ncbi:MAG: AAA family ATPase [Clostridiales bacterium]|nr:AAA family ATPase [Clostridiales bacterium]
MRLIRCHIENFGKLHDVSVDFEQGCHVICAENGWGKSTLAAFIRVMLFGFEGESRRKNIENERKRYQPWQGGGYGGSLTFEAGGAVYTATRIFGDKKANDSFELRDDVTNVKSEAYTENLGEDLFSLNSESFMRTVFIGQNDCVTGTTDRINARLGNITDNMNDLDCYEKATGALQEVLNRLNPRRKTGEIYRMNDRVTRLQTEVSQGAALEDSIRQYEEMEAQERQRLREISAQQETIFAQQRQTSRLQDARAKRAAYRQLSESCEEKAEAYQRAAAVFPGEIPTEEELRVGMAACDEAERAAEGARICRLTQEEMEELRALEEQMAAGQKESPKQSSDLEACGDKSLLSESRKGEEDGLQKPTQGKNGAASQLASGALFFIAGIILTIYFRNSGLFITILTVVLAAVGVLLLIVGLFTRHHFAEEEQKRQEEEVRKREEEERLRMAAEERRRWEEERARADRAQRQQRRDALAQKRRDYQAYRVQHEAARAQLADLFQKMGLPLSDAPREQLQTVWRQRIEWQQAKREADAARLKKQEFESQNGASLTPDTAEENFVTLEDLNRQQRKLEQEADAIRNQMEVSRAQLTSLREKYDEWTETKERLSREKSDLKTMREQYRNVQRAQEYLATAKETLTARYMEPLMNSFSRYYQVVAGTSGMAVERYRMDANTQITVEEEGMQRETAYLSRGYQDLIGFCLRLALVDAMYQEERPFLVLDDPFVNLDEEKTAGAGRLLKEVSEKYQIIYFTARDY